MRFAKISGLIGLSLLLAACNKPAENSSASATAPTTPASTAAASVAASISQPPVAATEQMIWFEPEAVATCDKNPVKVIVHWNARSVAGIKSIEVRALGPHGKETLFMHGGPMGQRETGLWMSAGRQMVLYDHADGHELARAKLGGLPCAAQ